MAQNASLDWRVGTLVRVQSGQQYRGTESATTETPGTVRTLSVPIVRTDQVYIITGGGMEYVVTESGRPPAHVVVNAPIRYAVAEDKFYFADEEGRQHPARIARQTLIDAGAVMKIEPTLWKSATGSQRYNVRRSAESIYAEQILDKRAKTKVTYEATWDGQQYVGHMHWVVGKCALTSEINLKASGSRIDGFYSFPIRGAKFDEKHCRYDENHVFPLVWVPQ
jgi:hypothetical protein